MHRKLRNSNALRLAMISKRQSVAQIASQRLEIRETGLNSLTAEYNERQLHDHAANESSAAAQDLQAQSDALQRQKATQMAMKVPKSMIQYRKQ